MSLDLTVGAGSKPSENFGRKAYVASRVIDAAELSMPADGVVKAIGIPDGVYLYGVRLKVLTAEGSALDIDVGDSSSVDKYLDAQDGNDGTLDTIDVTSAALITSADDVRLTFKEDGTDTGTAPGAVKVLVQALFFDMNYEG